MIFFFLGILLLGVGHTVCFLALTERRYSKEKNLRIYLFTALLFVLLSEFIVSRFWEQRVLAISCAYLATAAEWFVAFFIASVDPPCKKGFLFVSYANFFCIITSISIILAHGVFSGLSNGGADICKGAFVAGASCLVSYAYRTWLRPTVQALSGNQKKTWYAMTLVSALFFLGFTGFLLSCRIYFRNLDYLTALGLLLILYCAVLWVLFRVIQYMRDENRNELVNLNMTYLQGQVEQMAQRELLTKTIRHDIRHHCLTLAGMLENGQQQEALRYIQKYVNRMEETNARTYCTNMTVNVVLNHFADLAEKERIQFTAAADVREDGLIADLDYVAILSNLLENACSGCLEQGAEGMVRLDLRTVGEKTVIVCRNSCRQDLHVVDNMLVKRDVGVESILAAARKYHGDIRYEKEGGMLTACVILNG